jgi:CRP/FNR family cyclic AMP-dependent transcriptional regulator
LTGQIEQMQSMAYFAGLKTAELDSISHYLRPRSAQRGELILMEGGPAQFLYLVASGVVRVFLTSADGREQVLQLARPGDSFNDVTVFDGFPNLASATAMSQVLLYSIGKEDLLHILEQYPSIRKSAITILARQLRRLVSLISDLSFKRVTARLARLLLEQSQKADTSPYLTQQQMATMIGTVREMIGRALKDLELAGAIRMERHHIVVVDTKSLESISELPN